MAYTPEQIYAMAADQSAKGFSNEDIAAGAAKYGISADQLSGAYQQARPELFSSPAAASQMTNYAQTLNGGYSDDQIRQTTQQLLGSGSSHQDILAGANRLGISADRFINAIQSGNRSTYAYGGDPASAEQLANSKGLSDSVRGIYGSFATTPTPRPPNVQGGGGGGGGGQNPYLGMMANDIQRRSGEALGQGLQAIRGNAVGVGGLGGSRQGVAEGLAISGSNDNLAGQLAGMFGNAWNSDQNRQVQKYGIDTNAALGWGGLDNQRYGMDQSFYLGNQGQNQNFYTQQRGQDLEAIRTGASLYGMGNDGEWSGIKNFGSTAAPYTGYGTQTTTSGSGTDWGAALGNAGATYQQGIKSGWWK